MQNKLLFIKLTSSYGGGASYLIKDKTFVRAFKTNIGEILYSFAYYNDT